MAARRRVRFGLLAIGAVALCLILWVTLHKPPAKPAKKPVTPVTEATAVLQDVPVAITALGAAQAWRSDTILPQVNGKLLSVDFTEGTEVRAGQQLAQIDPAPYRAVLLQAQGALKRDEALLAEARIDLVRYQTLGAQDSISKQQVDTQAALVKQDEGIVLADKGAVDAAAVNLRFCRIVSPIAGRTGVRLIDPGNVVSTAGTTGIVIVNQIEPIAVTFTVPQGDFQRLSDLSDGFRKPLATVALSQDTGAVLGSGELSIADNQVSSATGTVELKAKFPNPDHHLWPGQFVNVRLVLQTLSKAVTIPAAAVNQGPKGPFAYVVGPDSKATVRPLVIAATQGDTAVIGSGLKAGETVVTDGQLTLRPGATVRARAPAAGGRRPS